MNSLAIKLDVNSQNQQDLNALLMKLGLKPQRRRFHCTVGVVEKAFDTFSEAESLVEDLKTVLALDSPLPFKVRGVQTLFRHVVALTPDSNTSERLQLMNTRLQAHIERLSDGRYTLNAQTAGEGYLPHITLWRQRRPNHRLKEAQDIIINWREAPLELVRYSFTIL